MMRRSATADSAADVVIGIESSFQSSRRASPVQLRTTPSTCWTVENWEYRPCPNPAGRFSTLISIHNHTRYSIEDLAPLNAFIRLGFMRPFGGILQRAFGLAWVDHLDYADIKYNPPFSPLDALEIERADSPNIGIDRLLLAITDHDDIGGSLELLRLTQYDRQRLALGEELSFRFQEHLFHLGVVGLETERAESDHASLQREARAGRIDELFEHLAATGCLVVLNHPLLPKGGIEKVSIPASDLLKRYGWAIHALEYNGMRSREENDAVIALAREVGKPLVGGGDSHSLSAATVVCASAGARDFGEFIDEVKAGLAIPFIKPHYFGSTRWKITLRVLNFIAHYRRVARFQGEPVNNLIGRFVLLDPVGLAARAFLRLTAALGLVR
ncbi:MAG: hypothetical protein AB1714_18620 [Acidobacteriota bacterium]